MVKGIETFKKFFEGHEDQYAIIGGAACDLIFSDVGAEFRATKDIESRRTSGKLLLQP